MWLLNRYILLLALASILAFESASAAPVIEELQPLSFGTLAITANSSVSQFTYPGSGRNPSVDGQIAVVSAGVPGSYRLSGFPSFSQLSVSIDAANLIASGVGINETLVVDNYDVDNLSTDAFGDAEIALGAILSTSGNGNPYVDTTYNGSATMRVEYWQPDVNAYVFNSLIINIETELRSTVTLSEEQELQFGTLFARTSSTDQASISVATSGRYSIVEEGDSRLVAIEGPEPGIIRVSGAAPFYELTITPQITDVLLTHSDTPSIAPHFILSNLTTDPVGIGRVDENGELTITIGGALKTEVTSQPEVYPDGEYEGMFELTVSY